MSTTNGRKNRVSRCGPPTSSRVSMRKRTVPSVGSRQRTPPRADRSPARMPPWYVAMETTDGARPRRHRRAQSASVRRACRGRTRRERRRRCPRPRGRRRPRLPSADRRGATDRVARRRAQPFERRIRRGSGSGAGRRPRRSSVSALGGHSSTGNASCRTSCASPNPSRTLSPCVVMRATARSASRTATRRPRR